MSPGGGAPAGGEELTEEHVRIVALVAQDWTDDRIARALGMSERTVRRRLREAERELGATSRLRLAVLAVKRGIVNGGPHDGRTRPRPEEG